MQRKGVTSSNFVSHKVYNTYYIMIVDMDFLLDRAIDQLIENLPPPRSKNREKYELFA